MKIGDSIKCPICGHRIILDGFDIFYEGVMCLHCGKEITFESTQEIPTKRAEDRLI